MKLNIAAQIDYINKLTMLLKQSVLWCRKLLIYTYPVVLEDNSYWLTLSGFSAETYCLNDNKSCLKCTERVTIRHRLERINTDAKCGSHQPSEFQQCGITMINCFLGRRFCCGAIYLGKCGFYTFGTSEIAATVDVRTPTIRERDSQLF